MDESKGRSPDYFEVPDPPDQTVEKGDPVIHQAPDEDPIAKRQAELLNMTDKEYSAERRDRILRRMARKLGRGSLYDNGGSSPLR